jgi:hypothetical protein
MNIPAHTHRLHILFSSLHMGVATAPLCNLSSFYLNGMTCKIPLLCGLLLLIEMAARRACSLGAA